MNIKQFLKLYNISFREYGKNVQQGNINIKCPFPGCADKSHHMGILIKYPHYYGCWKDSSHSGKDFAKLISVLLRCGYYEAKKLTKDKVVIVDNPILQIKNLLEKETSQTNVLGKAKTLSLPKDFLSLEQNTSLRFFNYLYKIRGFRNKLKLNELIKKYNIMYSPKGSWRNRIIFPVYFRGQLVTWTSRSIINNAFLKHKDLGISESVRHIKHCLYDFDNLKGGDYLYIVEGIFDCLKLKYYFPDNYDVTAISTRTIRDSQILLLKKLSKKYGKLIILLDSDALVQSFNISKSLSLIKNVEIKHLPDNVKDPGEMCRRQVEQLLKIKK